MNMISNLIGKKSIEKEVKKMKKLFAIMLSMALVFSWTAPAFAFTSILDTTFEAEVTPVSPDDSVITGFDATLRNISDDSEHEDDYGDPLPISWPAVDAGDNWVAAQQYIDIQGFTVYSGWGIQIYTDNKNGTDHVLPVDFTGDPAGLVRADGEQVLPVCWRPVIDDYKLPSDGGDDDDLTIVQKYIPPFINTELEEDGDFYILLRRLTTDDENHYDDNDTPNDYSDDVYFAPWAWMQDVNTPGKFSQANPVVSYDIDSTFVSHRGIRIAPGEKAENYKDIPLSTTHYYAYLGAKFTNATGETEYGTDTLTVEMYHLD